MVQLLFDRMDWVRSVFKITLTHIIPSTLREISPFAIIPSLSCKCTFNIALFSSKLWLCHVGYNCIYINNIQWGLHYTDLRSPIPKYLLAIQIFIYFIINEVLIFYRVYFMSSLMVKQVNKRRDSNPRVHTTYYVNKKILQLAYRKRVEMI